MVNREKCPSFYSPKQATQIDPKMPQKTHTQIYGGRENERMERNFS